MLESITYPELIELRRLMDQRPFGSRRDNLHAMMIALPLWRFFQGPIDAKILDVDREQSEEQKLAQQATIDFMADAEPLNLPPDVDDWE